MFDKNLPIAIASDHAGYTLKQFIIRNLRESNYTIKDYGTHSEDSMDYPDIAHPMGKDISSGKITRGIIICGSGNGVNMAINKHKNVRSALCWRKEISELARKHNDANVIALPARFIDFEVAYEMVKVFFNTKFEGERHQLRVDKINL